MYTPVAILPTGKLHPVLTRTGLLMSASSDLTNGKSPRSLAVAATTSRFCVELLFDVFPRAFVAP